MHFKLEKNSMPVGIDTINYAVGFATDNGAYLDFTNNIGKDVEFSEKSWRVALDLGTHARMQAFRDVSEREIAEANLKLMPGFRFSWYYTGVDFNPDPLLDFPIWTNNYKYSKNNLYFIREALNSRYKYTYMYYNLVLDF